MQFTLMAVQEQKKIKKFGDEHNFDTLEKAKNFLEMFAYDYQKAHSYWLEL